MDFTCQVWLQCLTAQKESDNIIVRVSTHLDKKAHGNPNHSLIRNFGFCYQDGKMEKQKNVNLKLTYT